MIIGQVTNVDITPKKAVQTIEETVPKILASELEGLSPYEIAEIIQELFEDELIQIGIGEREGDKRLLGLLDGMFKGQPFEVASKKAGFTTSNEAEASTKEFLEEANSGEDLSYLLSRKILESKDLKTTSGFRVDEDNGDVVTEVKTPVTSSTSQIDLNLIQLLETITGQKFNLGELNLEDFINSKLEQISQRLKSSQPRTSEVSTVRSKDELTTSNILENINQQLIPISREYIEEIINNFSDIKDKTYALQVLQRITQFGKLDSLNVFLKELEKYKGQGYRIFTEGRGSLAEVIQYLQKKGNYGDTLPQNTYLKSLTEIHPEKGLSKIGEKKILLILDDALLESLENHPENIRHLIDLKKKHGYEIKFIHPEGWVTGINPFNQCKNSFETKVEQILVRAKELQAEFSCTREEGISRAIMEPVYNRLELAYEAAGIKEKIGKLEIVQNKSLLSHIANEDDIVNNLAPRSIDEDQLENILNQFPDYEQEVLELLQRNLLALSQRAHGMLSQILHKEILSLAEKKSIPEENIYFYIPEKQKSYSIVTMQHKIANEIPERQILTFKDQLPEDKNSMVVILDDFAGTGKSGVKDVINLRKRGYQGKIVIAPLVAATPAQELFKELELEKNGVSFLPLLIHEPFILSDFYKNLPKEKQRRFDKVLRNMNEDDGEGFGNYGTSVVFPSMSTNTNNQFIQVHIALLLTLNSCGVNANGNQMKKQVRSKKKELVHTGKT